MTTLLLLFVLCNNELDDSLEVVKRVDLIELNQYYYSNGSFGGTQLIFYKWKNTCISIQVDEREGFHDEVSKKYGDGYEVIGYHLLPFSQHQEFTLEERKAFVEQWKRKYPWWTKDFPELNIPSDVPRIKNQMLLPRQMPNGDYTVAFKHHSRSEICRVYAPRLVRSITDYDREVYHRNFVPQEKRETF
jgi:hypothetical protein